MNNFILIKKVKKGQGLPLNILVMMILGLIIFGLGVALFSKISNFGDGKVDDWDSKIKKGMSVLECDGEEWICSPTYKIKTGEGEFFNVFVSNKADEKKDFEIQFPESAPIDGKIELTRDCGTITLYYPQGLSIEIMSGESAEIPFKVIADRVKSTPCTFVTAATAKITTPAVYEKTPIIIRVE